MRQMDLEPGFLQVFRIFVIIRMVFWVVIGPILVVFQLASGNTVNLDELTRMNLIERLALPNVAPMLAVEVLLLLLLLLPQVPRYLGRWFLPVTLLVALAPLLVGYYWWPSDNPLQTPFAIFFLVMLVLIAWHYTFWHVLVYVVGLTVYQTLLSRTVTFLPLSIDMGWLLMQAAMMLIVGYVIVKLVFTGREQRAALAEAYQKQAAANVRLQRYAAALEELTISRERNRLARELHDTLAHSLSGVTVQLEAVRSLWDIDPKAAKDMLDRADKAARKGLTEARRSLRALRASPLRDLGLPLALQELAETAAARAGVKLELRIPEGLDGSLSPATEQGVYRIAQEALENVVRHAEASTLVVCLERNSGELALVVEDNGRGMDVDAARGVPREGPDRLGMQGMYERASLIGARLETKSQPGQGTQVHLAIPL